MIICLRSLKGNLTSPCFLEVKESQWAIELSQRQHLKTRFSVLPVRVSVHRVCAWCPWRSEEDIRSLQTRVRFLWETPSDVTVAFLSSG